MDNYNNNYQQDYNQGYNQGYDPGYGGYPPQQTPPQKSIKGLKIMIVILAVILGALSVLYFTQVKQMQADYAEARDTLTARLTMMLANYDTLSTENDTLAQHLTTERFKADSLLETLKNERVLTRRKIKDYEKRLGYMRTVMEGYIHQIDSLNTLNQKLVNENITYRKQITSARLRADKAEEKAQELSTKVQKGAVIRARDIALVALNRSDKVVSRAARAERLRVDLRAGQPEQRRVQLRGRHDHLLGHAPGGLPERRPERQPLLQRHRHHGRQVPGDDLHRRPPDRLQRDHPALTTIRYKIKSNAHQKSKTF